MVCTLAVLLIKWWKRECDLQRRQLATQTITHHNRQNKKQKHSNINEWYLWLKYLTTFQLLVGINLIHVNIALLQKTWLTLDFWDRPYAGCFYFKILTIITEPEWRNEENIYLTSNIPKNILLHKWIQFQLNPLLSLRQLVRSRSLFFILARARDTGPGPGIRLGQGLLLYFTIFLL